ncbi:diguanylate cyclase [Marinimicrobium sp. ABcell2]|uniref:diguanylate cyclase n=1 Tax=Marinimicrobium sp. ABcell2 TaxID=3069751 RepID=UPI0027B30C2F|nr:diguanylate cyclase [Marinimicrobium sp. ABcell2]MDQ2077660.1 diguanylate cyclase [Marinimicrobium sp. ABcell2]
MLGDAERQSVLVVDDSDDIHQLVSVRLKSEQLSLLHAYGADEALATARHEPPDLFLLDLDMPGTDGLTLCQILKEEETLKHIPVVFLTGTLDVNTKVKAFDLGAVDYVTKPFDSIELKARVGAALRTKRYHDLLTTKAHIDALTGLWDRGYLDEQLSSEVSLLHRKGRPVSLLMLDIDHFKPLNDTYGHPFGDRVIQRVAQVLNRLSRESDITCRYGGEEFCMILRDTTTDGAMVLAERIRQEVAALDFKANAGPASTTITISIGVSGSDAFENEDNLPGQTLLEASDRALYMAKSNGRNRVESA